MLDRIRNWVTNHPPRVIVLGWMLVLVLLAIAGLLLVRGANAASLSGSFTLPTQYEDGTPLPIENIRHVRVEAGTCSGASTFGVTEANQLVTPPATDFTVTVPRQFGQFCVRAQTETTLGTLSAWTPAASKTIPEPPPKPPVLSSSITIAYETWQFRDKVHLGRSVGTLPLGTPCGVLVYQSFGATYYEIPREAVTFSKVPNKSGPLVTQCTVS